MLFLARNIEDNYDKLKLSFIPVNVLNPKTLMLKIWDDSIKHTPIFNGSARTIGDCEGETLSLNGHEPFFRCLSFQAMLTWEESRGSGSSHAMPSSFGNEEDSTIFNQHEAALRMAKGTESDEEWGEEET